ncbi:MAG: IclR family transcriptional regulator C-terminal domain-containing protein [Candidatus Hydrothermarchaeales archaeon]
MILSAHLPERDLDRLIREKGLKSFTPKTVTDPLAFKGRLARVRERDFSFSNEEAVVGVRAIAAPIRDGKGQVVAAVGVALPVTIFPFDNLSLLEEMVIKTAKTISHQIEGELIEPTP